MERDYFMTAQEAKEYGIIDTVSDPARRRSRRSLIPLGVTAKIRATR